MNKMNFVSRLSSFARNNGIVLSLDEDIKYSIMKFFFETLIFMDLWKKKIKFDILL